MQARRFQYAFLAADADAVAASQTPVAGGNLTLVSSTVTFTYGRLVTVTSVANETGRTFTVYGTDSYGATISESIAGLDNNTATGTKYFKTVTRVAVDDATADAITIGASHKGAWPAIPLDTWANPVHVTNYVTSSNFSTLTVTLQSTADDPFSANEDADLNWTSFNAGIGANTQAPLVKSSTEIPLVATAIRLITATNSSDGAATVNLAVLQAGGGRP